MDRISEQYDLVIAQRIHNLIVVLDELLLLVFIELAGDGTGGYLPNGRAEAIGASQAPSYVNFRP
jgi:hypothetical protein